MRTALIALTLALTLVAVGCGGGGSGSSRKSEQTLALEQAPTATNDAGVQARITYYKQNDRYLIVKLSLTNNGKDTVLVKNGDGTTMPGFRATVEGQTFLAERKGGTWSPWTGYRAPAGGGSNNLEIPAGVTAALELRWNFQMSRKDYDWTVIVGNLSVKDAAVKDIALSWPPAGAAPAK